MSNTGFVDGQLYIQEFIQQTGAPSDTAWQFLTNSDWNIQKAVFDYNRAAIGQPIIYSSSSSGGSNKPSDSEGICTKTVMRLPRYNVNELENSQHMGAQRIGFNAGKTSNPPTYGISYPPKGLPTLTENKVVEATLAQSALQPLEIEGAPRLARGMSRVSSNEPLVFKIRDINIKSIAEANQNDAGSDDLNRNSAHTFVLPNIYSTQYAEDQRAFLHHDLIETSTLVALEQSGHLNWWADIGVCQRLMPMVTSGDGNCLLHAASLAMWGFHDRQLGLRESLSRAMSAGSASFREGIKRRWRWSVSITNRQIGLVYSEEEWEREWGEMVNLASPKPRGDSVQPNLSAHNQSDKCPVMYESLEELHVFVLAHVLQRPIIVIAKTMLYGAEGEAMCPIPFSGIYLPLERDPSECHRTPLLLTYDSSHFSALVPLEFNADLIPHGEHIPADAIPLVNADLELLTIHYLIDPERNDFDIDEVLARSPTEVEKLELLREYLDVVSAPIPEQSAFDQGLQGYGDGLYESENGPPEAGTARFKMGHNRSDSEGSGFKSDSSGGGRGDPTAMQKKSKVLGKKDKNLGITEEQKGKSSNPITSVAKSFGNIRHNISKAVKGSGNGRSDLRQRRPSMGAVTQSTRRVSKTVDVLPVTDSRRQVTCASLRHRQLPDHWLEFIKNYLSSALQRFQDQQDNRRKQHEEIKRLSTERIKSGSLRPISLQVGSNQSGSAQWYDGQGGEESRSKTLDVRRFARSSDDDGGRYSKTTAKGIGDGSRTLAGTAGAQWIGGTLPPDDITTVRGNSIFYMRPEEDHCLSPNTENRLLGERLEQNKDGKKNSSQGPTKIMVMPSSMSKAVFDPRNKDFKQREGGPMATNTLPANSSLYPVKASNKQTGNAMFQDSNSLRAAPTYGPPNMHNSVNQSKSVPISSGQKGSNSAKFEVIKSSGEKFSANFATSEADALTQKLWLDKVAGSPNLASKNGAARSQVSSTHSSDSLKKASGGNGVPSSRSAGSNPEDSLASVVRGSVTPAGGTVRKCRTPGCQFHGNSQQDYYCSSCYRSSSYGVVTFQTSATKM